MTTDKNDFDLHSDRNFGEVYESYIDHTKMNIENLKQIIDERTNELLVYINARNLLNENTGDKCLVFLGNNYFVEQTVSNGMLTLNRMINGRKEIIDLLVKDKETMEKRIEPLQFVKIDVNGQVEIHEPCHDWPLLKNTRRIAHKPKQHVAQNTLSNKDLTHEVNVSFENSITQANISINNNSKKNTENSKTKNQKKIATKYVLNSKTQSVKNQKEIKTGSSTCATVEEVTAKLSASDLVIKEVMTKSPSVEAKVKDVNSKQPSAKLKNATIKQSSVNVQNKEMSSKSVSGKAKNKKIELSTATVKPKEDENNSIINASSKEEDIMPFIDSELACKPNSISEKDFREFLSLVDDMVKDCDETDASTEDETNEKNDLNYDDSENDVDFEDENFDPINNNVVEEEKPMWWKTLVKKSPVRTNTITKKKEDVEIFLNEISLLSSSTQLESASTSTEATNTTTEKTVTSIIHSEPTIENDVFIVNSIPPSTANDQNSESKKHVHFSQQLCAFSTDETVQCMNGGDATRQSNNLSENSDDKESTSNLLPKSILRNKDESSPINVPWLRKIERKSAPKKIIPIEEKFLSNKIVERNTGGNSPPNNHEKSEQSKTKRFSKFKKSRQENKCN